MRLHLRLVVDESAPALRSVVNDLKPDICTGLDIDDEESGTLSRLLSEGTNIRLGFHADDVIILFSQLKFVVKRRIFLSSLVSTDESNSFDRLLFAIVKIDPKLW
mmetsp:Transcript_10195/g.25568  ORF Transcript_10195/g.25568 Transcript_10195/m.25568 type:complete len:105 (-) Transcript_10195:8-322(-)